MRKLLTITVFSVIAFAAGVLPLQAGHVYWTGGGTGNFNDPMDWGGALPVSGDWAHVSGPSTPVATITADFPNNPLADLYAGDGWGGVSNGPGKIVQTGGAVQVSNWLQVPFGPAGGTSSYEMTGGRLDVSPSGGGMIDIANASKGVMVIADDDNEETPEPQVSARGLFVGGRVDANGIGALRQSAGAVTVSGANAGWPYGALRIGEGASGYYGLSGGTMTIGDATSDFILGTYVPGVIDQSGGEFSYTSTAGAWLRGGFGPTGKGILNVTGGTFSTTSASGHIVCDNGRGVLSISGTGTVNVNAPYGLVVTNDWGWAGFVGLGVVNLGAVDVAGGGGGGSGGALNTTQVTAWGNAEAHTALFNFHGGTLRPLVDSAAFMSGLTGAYVYKEGAVIDTDGSDITVAQNLLAPSGDGVKSIALTGNGAGYIGAPAVIISGGGGVGATAKAVFDAATGTVTGIVITNPGTGYTSDPTVTLEGGGSTTAAVVGAIVREANATTGGLRKLGLGTLTLSGNSTYLGDTSVEAGALSVTGSITSNVDVVSNATLKGAGTITGDVVAAAGSTIDAGTSVGTLTIDGNATVNGGWNIQFDGDVDPGVEQAVDKLAVTGDLDLGGAAISWESLGVADLAPGRYEIATYGGTLTEPADWNAPAGMSVEVTETGSGYVELVVIPEPSTLVLLAFGLISWAAYMRRR